MAASTSQTALCIVLDTRLTFEENLKEVVNKTNKTIGLLRKLQNISPTAASITIPYIFSMIKLTITPLL